MSNHPTIGWPGAQFYQDAEGTIPVLKDGDPVGLVMFDENSVPLASTGSGGHPVYRDGMIDMRQNQIMQAVREASK